MTVFETQNLPVFDRCARYTNVPTNCIMVADPSDPTCCKVPQCPVQPTAGPTPTPGFIPNPQTPKPGVITGLGPVIKPTLSPPLHEGQTTQAPQPRTGTRHDSSSVKRSVEVRTLKYCTSQSNLLGID